MATNPNATGSAGPAFEANVGAACLVILLTRGAPFCLGTATLSAVHFQAGHLDHGWQTDDILLEGVLVGGKQVKAALQAKRTFVISATDEECIKTIRGALADFRNAAQFDQTRDAIGIVTSSLSAKLARAARTLLDCARASTSADDMERRLKLPNYLGKPTLNYYQEIIKILDGSEGGSPTKDETWRFLQRFHIVDIDLTTPGGVTETLLRSLLTATTPANDPAVAAATWNELVALVVTDTGRAMSYTRDKLPTDLLERHDRTTGYSIGIARLVEDSEVVIDGIRTTIGGKTTLTRTNLLTELCELVEHSSLVFVTGDAGSGKSALVKSAFATITKDSVGFAFRAVSLAGVHINDVLNRFGLTLAQLQAQTIAHARKILWVESLEQLLERPAENRAAFTDLLRGLSGDPSWCIVITARNYSAETIRAAFFSEVGITASDVQIGELDDTDLDYAATELPHLIRPLSHGTLRPLLKNPFFLDMAASVPWPITEELPSTERSFRTKVWDDYIRRVHEDAQLSLPNSRAEVLVSVARRRATALEPFVDASDLDQLTLTRLLRDSVLQTARAGSNLYAPAHDVFEDWALMKWLDQQFEQHGKKLIPVLTALGTYPALRRAYRRWLTESLDADPDVTDSLTLGVVNDSSVQAHWREDTFVSILLSKGATGFLHRNVALLVADNSKLLHLVIHLLRVACKVAVPRKLFGLTSEGEFFFPKGNGWIGAAQLLEIATASFSEADLGLVVGFLEDWALLTRYGIAYPKAAHSIVNVAWHWHPLVPWRSSVTDARKRLLRVILTLPLAGAAQLKTAVESALKENNRRDDLLQLIFNHFACDAIVRDMPDLSFGVAEDLLGLKRTLEEVVNDRADNSTEHVNYAFGLGGRFAFDDYPASAYHGPYLRMLWHHPARGVDFILRFVNRAAKAFAHPQNRYEYIQPPGKITIEVEGILFEQHADHRLFGCYRGMSVSPYSMQSALMALERWLLDKAKNGDGDLEAVLLDLLRRTNNAAVTAVVASIAVAYPLAAGEAAYSLLTCRPLLRADQERSVQESFNPVTFGGLSLGSIDLEKGIYEDERKEASKLPHRRQNLEYTAVILQMTPSFNTRVWALIDRYRGQLPPEAEQDEGMKIWRIQLHRIDTRNFVEMGHTDEGHQVIGSSDPEPDLQEFIDERKPHSEAVNSAIGMLNWGMLIMRGNAADADKWREYLQAAQKLTAAAYGSADDNPAVGGPAYVAAVCIRDHWTEMSTEEQTWCAHTTLDAIEADADTSDHFAIAARNPMEGSRPAAFVISALFGKALDESAQTRLLPVFAKAVVNAVPETVSHAMQGIGIYLWGIDRPLALTCLHALMTQAIRDDEFLNEQRQLPYSEHESEEAHDAKIRDEMRASIVRRHEVDEEYLAKLDLPYWPRRKILKHLFVIAAHKPHDALFEKIMGKSIALLPQLWESDQKRHQVGPHSREAVDPYDPHFEHDMVKASCHYLIQQAPDQAAEMLKPVLDVVGTFPSKVADVVNWLVLAQGDRVPAQTFWSLWQRFADTYLTAVDLSEVDEEQSEEGKLLQELFLGVNWAEQRDWLPLHGETERLRLFFRKLPPLARAFDCYSYYLAKEGTPTLPDALTELSEKLQQGSTSALLNETTIFYLEEILTRLIYGGNSRVRSEEKLRQATLTILDALVVVGSSRAYKLRDDFLTPSH